MTLQLHAPFWISLYMRKIWYSFFSVYGSWKGTLSADFSGGKADFSGWKSAIQRKRYLTFYQDSGSGLRIGFGSQSSYSIATAYHTKARHLHHTVKKAVELLDAPSKNTFLKSNKYNSTVEIVYSDTHVFFSPLCNRMRKFDIREVQ